MSSIIASLLSCAINPNWVLKYNLPSAAYIHFFGLYQHWAMFEKAPTGNYYLVFIVTFKNGKKEFVDFAHMNELDFFKRLQMHRFRKFQQSSVFNPANSFLWKDLCLWVLANYPAEKRAEVQEIVLARNFVPLSDSSTGNGQEQKSTKFVFTYYPSRGEPNP